MYVYVSVSPHFWVALSPVVQPSLSVAPIGRVKAKVPSLATGAHRQIPTPFLVPSDRAAMANLTIPMEESVTFKRKMRKKAVGG